MSGLSPLDRLARAFGIQPGFTDIWGRLHETSAETMQALLSAMGVAAGNDKDIEASLAAVDARAFERLVPKARVIREGEPLILPVATTPEQRGRLSWSLVTEDGIEHRGEAQIEALDILDQGIVQGQNRLRRALPLAPLSSHDPRPAPGPLPSHGPAYGYHRCVVTLDEAEQAVCEVIVTPGQAWWPACLDRAGGLAGLMAPLYGLRSARNAGVGDLGDLGDLASIAAQSGADFVGVNPLHQLFPAQPHRISPYAPSSRRFKNILTIALDRVPELDHAPDARAMLEAAGGDFGGVPKSDLVDYAAVSAFKLDVMEKLYEAFSSLPPSSPRQMAFAAFRRKEGDALEHHARFDALAEQILADDPSKMDWRDWPAGYRSPDSEAVRDFASRHADRVSFYAYLQWLADSQLEQAQSAAAGAGMAIGLYLDLAVGVAADGAESWSDRTALVEPVRLGAPPDDFNPGGQNWGLLPFSPANLVESGYRPFIELLRSNMRHAGMLRIDHVMGLARSFWVPEGGEVPGGYVGYPVRDLLGLVALESQRHQCIVVGEDLGTVPKDLRAMLSDHRLLGCSVLYFERDGEGKALPASAYPKASVASIGTHDLPTLCGFWEGRDIIERERLGLYEDSEASARDLGERRQARSMFLDLLAGEGLLPDGVDPMKPPDALPVALIDAFHRFLGKTPAVLRAVQLEDVVGAADQANLPGTIDEYPNWRRRIGPSIEQLSDDPRLPALLAKR